MVSHSHHWQTFISMPRDMCACRNMHDCRTLMTRLSLPGGHQRHPFRSTIAATAVIYKSARKRDGIRQTNGKQTSRDRSREVERLRGREAEIRMLFDLHMSRCSTVWRQSRKCERKLSWKTPARHGENGLGRQQNTTDFLVSPETSIPIWKKKSFGKYTIKSQYQWCDVIVSSISRTSLPSKTWWEKHYKFLPI